MIGNGGSFKGNPSLQIPLAKLIECSDVPECSEADPYYFTYIDMVSGEDAIRELQEQLDTFLPILSRISEEKSLHRYAPAKWSIRQLLNHISDTERAFAFRALCFPEVSIHRCPVTIRILQLPARRPMQLLGPPM